MQVRDAKHSSRDELKQIGNEIAALKVDYAKGDIDETAYGERRTELGVRIIKLTHDRPVLSPNYLPPQLLAALAAASIALGAGLLTWSAWFRTPGAAVTQSVAPAASAAHPLSGEQLEHAIERSQERVKQDPKDAVAWSMLAHSYDMLGRYTEASGAYSRLIELTPDDPQILADAADSLALANGRRIRGEPMKLIERALGLDPMNPKALSLAATEASERGDFAQAIDYWQRTRAQVNEPALRRELDDRIAQARLAQERAASSPAAPSTQASASNATTGFVSGRIVLVETLKAQVSPDDVLFVFARPADGSRMPIALMRRRASELPIDFRLDDSMAMVPQSRLSTQNRVIVGARISKRGDVMPQPGDLQGLSAPVAVGTKGLQLEIAEVMK
jgi:cytochrome c-type biogenesis protein CcmH